MSITRSESRRIATRYVEALFALALKNNQQDAVGQDLQALRDVIAQSTELQKLIANPMVADSEKAAAFTAILEKMKAGKQAIESVSFIIRNKRVATLADVADLYIEKLSAHKGELTAEIITAKPLTDAQIKAVVAALKKAAGRDIRVITREDASILGGMIVKMGSRMLDHSVAGKLQRLKAHLASQAA